MSLPLLWRWDGERSWLLIGLCYCPPFFYALPWLVYIPLALGLRQRRLALVGSLMLLAVFFFPMGLQLPKFNLPKARTGDFKVLTYNVRAGLGGSQALAAYLEDQQADLIGLQECRQPMDRNFSDPTPAISKQLSKYTLVRGGIRGELVSLSRYPVIAQKEHDLDGFSPCLESRIEVAGRTLRFLNVHIMTGDPKGVLRGKKRSRTDYLVVTAQARHHQSLALRKILEKERLPTILVGDFNSPPNSGFYASLADLLEDSFAEAGWGFGYSFKSDLPIWRIDYIWHSRDLRVSQCRVQNSPLSDHKPLSATLF